MKFILSTLLEKNLCDFTEDNGTDIKGMIQTCPTLRYCSVLPTKFDTMIWYNKTVIYTNLHEKGEGCLPTILDWSSQIITMNWRYCFIKGFIDITLCTTSVVLTNDDFLCKKKQLNLSPFFNYEWINWKNMFEEDKESLDVIEQSKGVKCKTSIKLLYCMREQIVK